MTLEELTKPVKIGSIVKIRHHTNNLDQGQQVEIIGFRDDNPAKPYSKECMLGGWISEQRMYKSTPQCRVATMLEIAIGSKNPWIKILSLDNRLIEHFRLGLGIDVSADSAAPCHDNAEGDTHTILCVTPNGKYRLCINEIFAKETPILHSDDYSLRFNVAEANLVFAGGLTGDYPQYKEALIKSLETLKWTGSVAVNEKLVELVFKHSQRTDRQIKLKNYTVKAKLDLSIYHFSLYKGDNCLMEAQQRDAVVQIIQLTSSKSEILVA